MKKIVFVALVLFGMIMPTSVKAVETSDSLSVLLWLDFQVAEDDDNDDGVKPFSLLAVVDGKLYTDGQMELSFGTDEAVTVSINLNDAEVSSTEFVPTADDYSLTFDLNDYGRGAYEVNVAMPDGTVQTATFEY